jgi:hypothetical protein
LTPARSTPAHSPRASWLGVVVGLAVAAVIAGCVKGGTPRRITGTCGGACDYYLACKHNDDPAAREQCVLECREVFSDKRSLKAFESLTCKDAIEFVDGTRAAFDRPPSASPRTADPYGEGSQTRAPAQVSAIP